MTRNEYRRHPLTVGDGFRVGIGIAFWLAVMLVIFYGLVFFGLIALSVLGA